MPYMRRITSVWMSKPRTTRSTASMAASASTLTRRIRGIRSVHGGCGRLGPTSARSIARGGASAPYLLIVVLLLLGGPVVATDFKKEVIDRSYQHDRYVTNSTDLVRTFRAYVTSFDSEDDDDGDGVPDRWGIPHFVAYEMREHRRLPAGPKRPSPWITDPMLFAAGIAPADDSYAHSAAFLSSHPNWFVRGHLCMKQHAFRLGLAADWNTHTVLNAVPQRNDFNSGIWQDLEDQTAKWADEYGAVWIITGPIFEQPAVPQHWLGEKGEMKVAIPEALFKIVIKDSGVEDRPDVLAFVYPQTGRGYRRGPFNHVKYLRSVREIERVTKLDFFTSLTRSKQDEIEIERASALWQ